MFGSQSTKPYSPPRPLGQDYRRSASNEQAKSLALIYGGQRVGCEFISDVFDVYTSAVTSGGGKGGNRVQGYNYFASFIVAICHGPVKALHNLYLNGDPVFTNNTKIYAVSLALVNNVATFQTANPHGLVNGQTIVVYNCQQAEFNGEFVITVVSATQFQYTVPGPTIAADTATPVPGTSIYCYVKLDPIYAGANDSTQFTIPDFGTATIYWGTQTQPPDAYAIAASGVQHPPYRGVCYIVFRQLYLGFNQTSVQNIEVVVERTPAYPGMSFPSIAGLNGDCNPAGIAADLILNPRYGLGCDPNDDFSAASFNAAAEQFNSENVAFSPIITRPEEVLSQLNEILSMVDAAVTLDAGGRFAVALQREGTIGATVLSRDNLVDLPQLTPEDWSAVTNQTFINFLDRDAGWQPDFAVWNDTAGIYAKQRAEPQTLDKQFITTRGLATKLAAIAGQLAALPKCDGKLTVAFDAALWETLAPGVGFTLKYSAVKDALNRNNGVYRVTGRTIDDPAKPVFTIEVSLDRSYLYTTATATAGIESLAPPEGAPVPALVDVAPFASFAIAELPAPLCPNQKPAVAALVARDVQSLTRAVVYLGRNYTFTGIAPESYFELQTITRFAQHGALAADFPAASPLTVPANPPPAEFVDWPNPLPLAAGLQVQLDGVDLVLPDVSDFDALAADLILVVGNEYMAIAEATLTAPGAYTLTVLRGAFGTAIVDHAAGDTVFIIAREDLQPLQHPHFRTGNTGRFKLTLKNPNVGDAIAFDVVFAGANWKFPPYSAPARDASGTWTADSTNIDASQN